MKRSFERGAIAAVSLAAGVVGTLGYEYNPQHPTDANKQIQEEGLGYAAQSVGAMALEALRTNRAKIEVSNNGDWGPGVASIRIVTRGVKPPDSVAYNNELMVGIGRNKKGKLVASKTVGITVEYFDPAHKDVFGDPNYVYEDIFDPQSAQNSTWTADGRLELSGRGMEAFITAGGDDFSNTNTLSVEAEDLARKVLQTPVISDK